MSNSYQTDDRIQSIRIKKLEEQLHLVQAELQRLRKGMLQKNDMEKLTSFMERIKELNSSLVELKSYYNSLQKSLHRKRYNVLNRTNSIFSYDIEQKRSKLRTCENLDKPNHNIEAIAKSYYGLDSKQPQNIFVREHAGFDKKASTKGPTQDEELMEKNTKTDAEQVKRSDPFKTCKQLMDEIKPPGSILGNYLMRLQDFRADPDLRRQRWEKKQLAKLEQIKMEKGLKSTSEDKATNTEETDINADIFEDTALKNIDLKLINRSDDISASSERFSTESYNMPSISKNLTKTINNLVKDTERESIVLTLVLENDSYHISISHISDGQLLACFLATEEAVQDAKEQNLFQDFLTFFVVNAKNSISQKDRILGHLFEIIK